MSMPELTVRSSFHFKPVRYGRKEMRNGDKPVVVAPTGRIPRLSRLMALAIRFDELIRSGEVMDYADLARLGHVTRARVTQIMNLLNLAPDIQEMLLFLPETMDGRDPVKDWQVRPIAAMPCWRAQRRAWKRLLRTIASNTETSA